MAARLGNVLYWAFTDIAIMRRIRSAHLIAAIVLMLAVGFWLVRRKHVEDEVVHVLAIGDTGPIPKVSRPDDA